MIHMQNVEQILTRFKENGHRLTKVRKAMVTLFAKSPLPLSAEEIQRRIKVAQPEVNKTTIYREIVFLEETGTVQRIEFGDKVSRYELKDGGHHHHAVCNDCGRVEDVMAEGDVDKHEKVIARRTGFQVTSHSLEFFGVCAKCQS